MSYTDRDHSKRLGLCYDNQCMLYTRDWIHRTSLTAPQNADKFKN